MLIGAKPAKEEGKNYLSQRSKARKGREKKNYLSQRRKARKGELFKSVKIQVIVHS